MTNNSSIPTGALVRKVEAKGTISPSLGNTYRQVKNSQETEYHTSNSGGTSLIDITIDDQLLVKTTWTVRFYSLATNPSTWSKPSLEFTYQYDQTVGW